MAFDFLDTSNCSFSWLVWQVNRIRIWEVLSACRKYGRGICPPGFGWAKNPSRERSHVFTYSAICHVPQESLLHVTALLRGHRRAIDMFGDTESAGAHTGQASAALVS
jgi:hypothetical protein